MPAAGPQQASDSSTLGCRSLARALSVLVCELASASVMAGAHKQRAKGTKHVVEGFPCKWPIQGQLWLTCPLLLPAVCSANHQLIWARTGSLAAAAAHALPYLAEAVPQQTCLGSLSIHQGTPSHQPCPPAFLLPTPPPQPLPCSRRSHRPRCWAAPCSRQPCPRTSTASRR